MDRHEKKAHKGDKKWSKLLLLVACLVLLIPLGLYQLNSHPKTETNLIVNQNQNNKVTEHDVKEVAISSIAKHDSVSKEKIKITDVKNIDQKTWFVLYQTQDEKGLWNPAGGDYGVEMKQSTKGNLEASFVKYDISTNQKHETAIDSKLPNFEGTMSRISSNDSSTINVTKKMWEQAQNNSNFSPIKGVAQKDFNFIETVKGTINDTPFQIDFYSESKTGNFNVVSKYGDHIKINFPAIPTMTPFVFYGENVYLMHKAKGRGESFNIVKQKFFDDQNKQTLGHFLSESVKRDNELQVTPIGSKIKIANNDAILYQKHDIVYVIANGSK